jgi:amino acid transporter
MLTRFELLTSMVSFGALVGFLMLHFSVLAHFGRQRSRNWLRHYLVPAIGLCIIGYVLWNAEANAKIIGLIWLTIGVVIYVSLKVMGRPATVPIS